MDMKTLKTAKNIHNNRNAIPCSSNVKKDIFPICASNLGDEGYNSLSEIKPLPSEAKSTVWNNMSIIKNKIYTILPTNNFNSTSYFEDIANTNENDKNDMKIPLPRRSSRLNHNTSPVSPITPVQLSNNDHGGKENILYQVKDNELEASLSSTVFNYDNTSSSNKTESIDTTKNGKYSDDITANVSGQKSMTPKLDSVGKKISISTKSFYSSKLHPKSISSKILHVENSLHGNTTARARNERRSFHSINKGVHHKIRRPSRSLSLNSHTKSNVNVDLLLSNMRNEKLRNLITSKRIIRDQIEKVHSIFRNSANPIEMARPLSVLSSADDSNNNTLDIIVSKQKNDSFDLTETGFSDTEIDVNESELDTENIVQDVNEEIIPIITFPKYEPSESEYDCIETPAQLTKRKFFKTGRTTNTKKEVQITDHIKATVCNGKLRILEENMKIKRKPKIITNKFSDEQATVDKILKALDDTVLEETEQSIYEADSLKINKIATKKSTHNDLIDLAIVDKSEFCESFHSRIPYKTTDPAVEEQQRLLLNFLISFNICTEENFRIFIADPENHKEEASHILDQFIVKGHKEFRERIPYNTSDPMVIAQQNRFLEYLIEHEICTEENFDIFIANYEKRKTEAAEILFHTETSKLNMPKSSAGSNLPPTIENNICSTENRILHVYSEASPPALQSDSLELQEETQKQSYPMFLSGCYQPLKQTSSRAIYRNWMGQGRDQYQIDAGQKQFGPQQCKQCGLLYNVHEPEEEKLHREFHSSLNILRYKGWIDEDIVAIYPEWGNDGRIIRLTNNSHTKRKERLTEILKIVDKELGFSSYIFPGIFVCYCAVRKSQIVGLCLVEPLSFANKYMSVKGIDCCTEEKYESKCGISRLWISPLHRRMRIASKLIQAVQLNTLPSEQIPIDKIAFSAPTEAGKMFAQKITKTEHFLVYQ
ncbi:N-acetyltransferase eco-like [Teleopsis dalmanni]|uniref:N-acetyltransferase eco-like n=2 Tax=Teleopsis dalmanni TaxID=139649 RepID=UPI0018CDAE4E|nr:N-acetyltransferase eco-like [Teleopsis dalmanni]